MKKENYRHLIIGSLSFGLFLLLTLTLNFVDVKAIGPLNTTVGFATLNRFVHNTTGANLTLYNITDWLGLVPIFFAFAFALLGLFQLIKRKSISKVDRDVLILGGFYLATITAYLFFENVVINYRPILINRCLEVSYPSSTTLLVTCVMPTAILQLKNRIKNPFAKNIVLWLLTGFIIFMVVGRLISGVHWFTDILGGILLSISLVEFYKILVNLK